jgi:putative endonuclease
MSGARQSLGRQGEDLACAALEARGYTILARRYRRRGGEVDIVALDGPTVVFVEVKTRRGSRYGVGADAVTIGKRRRIVATATDFLARHGRLASPCRFDVVAIDMAADRPVVELYRNAFDAP